MKDKFPEDKEQKKLRKCWIKETKDSITNFDHYNIPKCKIEFSKEYN